jgi:ATP synthase protein I
VPNVDALMLRRAGVITLVVGVICAIIGGVVAGGTGLLGGVLGTVLVIVFFSAGQAVVGRTIKNNPQMALTVALTVYLVKIGILFVLLILLQDATWFNTKVFAITIVACTIAWTVAEVWVYSGTKVLYVEPERKP